MTPIILSRGKVKKGKAKIWSTKKTDKEFSLHIRGRDKVCLKCGGTKQLTCSHFWSRRIAALRYEPDNCITLCWWSCHLYGWEKQKHGAYGDFMLDRLGAERFAELKRIAYQEKIKMKDAIKNCMTLLGADHE